MTPAGRGGGGGFRKPNEPADVAVLMVSADYLASEFILTAEMPALMKAAQERGLRLLWVPVNFSLFAETPIGGFQAASDPLKPLASLPDAELDETLVRITQRIAEAAGRGY